jgi:hypothetical protein
VRRIVALLALALVLAVSAVAAEPVTAASACWKTLLDDWYDGRIDGTYPTACYRSAIEHLPADAVLYSNAKAEITAALRARTMSGASGATGSSRVNGPVKRALSALGPTDATSPPYALVGIAAGALALLGAGLWLAPRPRRILRRLLPGAHLRHRLARSHGSGRKP